MRAPFEQELQPERRLADAGIALDEIDVVARKAADENVIESLDARRGNTI